MMRRPNHAVLILALAASLSCEPWRHADVSERPPELVLPDNANAVEYRIRGGRHGLTYTAAIPYPAEAFIADLAAKVAASGYRPLREHPIERHLTFAYASGWGDFLEDREDPPVRVHLWNAAWIGPHGEWLQYHLRYDVPESSGETLHSVRVQAIRFPAGAGDHPLAGKASLAEPFLMPPGAPPVTERRTFP